MSVDSRFERIIKTEEGPHEDGMAFLRSPEFIEASFFRPGGPVERLIERFRAAGISPEICSRYEAAVRAFFERPTQMRHAPGLRLARFSPKRDYFAPSVTFVEGDLAVTDVLTRDLDAGVSWRPRLQKEGHLEATKLTSQEAFARFSQPRSETKRAPHDREALEHLLAAFNRFQYSLHEPVHVMEGTSPGDLLNRILESVGGRELVSREKVAAFLKIPSSVTSAGVGGIGADAPEMATSILGYPEEKVIVKQSDRFAFATDPGVVMGQIETTIDFLSQKLLGDELKRYPTLVLWCHNNMAMVAEGLQELRERMRTVAAGAETDALSTTLDRMIQLHRILAPLYFSAFTDSDEARTFLLAQEHEFLGKRLVGHAAVTPAFTWLDMENAITDMTLAFEGTTTHPDLSVRSYPLSGQRHLECEGTAPLTDKGVTIATKISREAHKIGFSLNDLEQLFSAIETVSEAGFLDKAELRRSLRKIMAKTGFSSLSDEELDELYGAQMFIRVNLLNQYEKRFILRRSLLRAFEEDEPEAIQFLIENLFREAGASAVGIGYLLGFVDVKIERSVQVKHRPWQEVRQDKKLGIFAIDMQHMSAAERRQVEAVFRALYGTGLATGQAFEALRAYVAIKKRQTETRSV